MTNPFAPRLRRTGRERLSDLEQFTKRLAAAGATAEEIETVRATWDDFDADWTPERRAALTLASDAELRAEILATRDEYVHDTTSETAATADAASTHWERTLAEAAGVIGSTIPQVVGWVGADQIRAMAAVELETSEQGAKRKTLLETLRPLIEGDI